jgi:glycosyltransferase involved in cell wall biosynthesis
VEKNLEAFLGLKVRGHKVVVGDGPQRAALQERYPGVIWRGYYQGQELAKAYAEADVLVFPSLTDTFGLVMLEAMACGTPVAAYPVTGPRDVIREGVSGALDEDLARAVERALRIPRERVRAFAEEHDWRAIARRFREALIPLKGNTRIPLGLPLARQWR